MRWMMVVIVLGGFVAGADRAEGGVVVGRDGRLYAGKVELRGGNEVAIVSAGGDVARLAFADVARLSMGGEGVVAASANEVSLLPAPWRHADVGRVKGAGDAVASEGGFVLRGAGWGIWGPSDSCHVMYRPLVGDGEIVARVVDLPTEENGFQAGLTIRGGLEPDAAEASVMFHPGGIPHLNCRPVDGRGRALAAAGAQPRPWLRLIRAHDAFSAFCSADGQSWLPIGTVRVKMDEVAYAGLACAATANQEVARAGFDHVSVRAEPMGPTEGLGLVDGSLIVGRVSRFDAKMVTYSDGDGVERSMPMKEVAHVFTRPLPPEIRGKALAGRPRICMANGDVMEGQIKELRGGRVGAVSVLLGPQNLEFARVFMVVFRPVEVRGSFSVYVRDGSIYRCTDVQVGEGAVVGESAVVGRIDLKAADVVAIVREGR